MTWSGEPARHRQKPHSKKCVLNGFYDVVDIRSSRRCSSPGPLRLWPERQPERELSLQCARLASIAEVSCESSFVPDTGGPGMVNSKGILVGRRLGANRPRLSA
jgi:hypothetical protein